VIGIAPEGKLKAHLLRDLPAEVEHPVGTAGRSNKELKSLVCDLMEELKHSDQVRLARSIRSDEHVEPLQLEFLVANGLESSDSNAIEVSHGSGLLFG
jgi:hypothetical protein